MAKELDPADTLPEETLVSIRPDGSFGTVVTRGNYPGVRANQAQEWLKGHGDTTTRVPQRRYSREGIPYVALSPRSRFPKSP